MDSSRIVFLDFLGMVDCSYFTCKLDESGSSFWGIKLLDGMDVFRTRWAQKNGAHDFRPVHAVQNTFGQSELLIFWLSWTDGMDGRFKKHIDYP